MLDICSIQSVLTHRYPFLLVDRVTDYTVEQEITGYKNVSVNEPFFTGHFPGQPIMPGVLILEALAQLCGVLGYKTLNRSGHDPDTICVMAGVDNARFKRPVVPGDRLDMYATLANRKRTVWKFNCEAKVDGELAAKAVITVAEKTMTPVQQP